MAKVKNCLSELSAQQLDEHYPDLAGSLGLLFITGKLCCQELLPKDSVFMMHCGFVQDALNAFRNNQLEDMETALKKLPFRSAFRDFRILMKAVISIPDSIEQAQSLLAKIPADSPYRQAGALLLAVTHQGATLVNDLLQLTPPQIKIIKKVKNFDNMQVELVEALSKPIDHLSDKVKFDLAIQYQTLFGVDLAKHYCLTALSTYPAGRRDFIKHFGAMDNFQAWRLKALSCERDRDFHGAEYYWKQGITVLKNRGAVGDLKIALIMRHIAAHQQSPEEAIRWLIESLYADPEDRETYVKILQYYERQEQETDAYQEWLDKSIMKFPKDVELLSMAIKASTRNKATKNAVQYAQALLEIDPVNTFAKQVLFTSHLTHVRKLIKSKKFHLVEKELKLAEQIPLGKRYQTQAQLMRGFFVFVTADKQQGAQLIAASVQKLDDGLVCAYFCANMEALLLDLQGAPALKELPPLTRDYVLNQREMTQLIKLIQQYADGNISQGLLHQSLEKPEAAIKQTFKQSYSEATLLTLCQCLDRIGHFELLHACVKIAQPLWDNPMWMYYRVNSEVNGSPEKCSYINRYRLQESLNTAQKQKDQRAVAIIGKFLDQNYELNKPSGFNISDPLFGGIDDVNNPIDELFGHLSDGLHDQLMEKTVEITNNCSPEQIHKILAADFLSYNQAMMISLLENDSDALQSLLMLKAANDLGMDIGVTGKDIVEYFNGQKTTSKHPPFPFLNKQQTLIKSPYEILEVNQHASDYAIKQAYLQKVKLYPPDRNHEKFQQIHHAYEAIKNITNREKYALFNSPEADFDALLVQAFNTSQPSLINTDDLDELLRASIDDITSLIGNPKKQQHE